MVLLVPMLEGEHARGCTTCPTVGIGSPIRERSTFERRRDGGWYDSQCVWCAKAARAARRWGDIERHREAERARYAARKARKSPEAVEADRAGWKARKAVEKESDPEGFRRRKQEAQRRYRQKRKRELGVRALREEGRIERALRRERNGRELEVAEARKSGGTTGDRLPIGPFRAWVEDLIERERRAVNPIAVLANHVTSPEQTVAFRLNVSTRRLWEYRRGQSATISEGVVDAAVSAEGTAHIWELYPALYGMEAARGTVAPVLPFRMVTRPQGPREDVCGCRSPGCLELPIEGARFCTGHAEKLARVREMMEADSAAYKARAGNKNRKPRCCRQGCLNNRVPPRRFCAECEDAGFIEEDE